MKTVSGIGIFLLIKSNYDSLSMDNVDSSLAVAVAMAPFDSRFDPR